MFKKILVPTDGSPLSTRAVKAAMEFAKINSSAVVGLAVAELYPYPLIAEGGIVPDLSGYEEAIRVSAREQAEGIAALASSAAVACTVTMVEGFTPHEEILRAAREHGCDLIWMASHGRRGLDKFLMGSETQRVLAQAMVPVMVYR